MGIVSFPPYSLSLTGSVLFFVFLLHFSVHKLCFLSFVRALFLVEDYAYLAIFLLSFFIELLSLLFCFLSLCLLGFLKSEPPIKRVLLSYLLGLYVGLFSFVIVVTKLPDSVLFFFSGCYGLLGKVPCCLRVIFFFSPSP